MSTTRIKKSDFFLAYSPDPHVCSNGEEMGEPKGTNRCAESAQGLPKVPLHGSRRRLFTKRGDLHETSLFNMFEAHSAGPRNALGDSFGLQSRPKDVQMPLLGRLGRNLKMHVFSWRGPDAHFGSKMVPFWTVYPFPFGVLFCTFFEVLQNR